MPTDPHKPATVPDGAYWDAGDREWVLPQRNAAGQFHGLVKWYRPDGTLCCATDHVDGTPHGRFTRYHENGEQARTGTFLAGKLHGPNVFTRSTGPTTENFPAGLGPQIWRCEMDFVDGQMTEGRLFDREGRRVMEDGTPFPTERPVGVPASAHFRKTEEGTYRWVEGGTRQVGDDWHRVGLWRSWTAAGVLVREAPYDDGELHGSVRLYHADTGQLLEEQRYEHGERRFDRPTAVPIAATFDAESEQWVLDADGDGDSSRWDASGLLRYVETYERGELVRVREYLSDGSLAQDSVLFDGGVPRRKWFRRTADEELQSFPNVSQEDAREVQYMFDEHGRMASFRITGDRGAVLEEQTLYRNARNDTEQARFPSIEAASAAWIAEGDRYTSELNRWLAEMYASEDGEVSFEEPTFDRHDLERAVIDGVAALNAANHADRARTLFPLYHDGIGAAFWDRFGLVVDAVLETADATLARVVHPSRGPRVMRITRTAIEPVPELLAFGASRDKRVVAYAFDDRLELHGHEVVTLPYPTRYEHAGADAHAQLGTGARLGVRALRVAPSGREVLVIAAAGIFVVGPTRTQRLYPLDETLDEYVAEHEGGPLALAIRFPNADVSPAGDRITCGGMFRRGIMAGLAIYRREGDRWFVENTSQNDAFFPAQAVFHHTRPHIAYAACLYASLSNRLTNTTFRIDLDSLPPGEIDAFGGGIAREPGRVQTIASFGPGFLLGFDNGYIRWMGVDDNAQLLGYMFVGGSVLAIDVAPDQRSFTVATDAGVVSRFTLAERPARNLIATMPLSDDARTCFFRTFPPLRW